MRSMGKLLAPLSAARSLAGGDSANNNTDTPELAVNVRPVATAEELTAIVALRRAGYGRHRPEGRHASMADPFDRATNAVVLAAFDKSDGALIGSLRVLVSDGNPLELDEFELLDRSRLGRCAEGSRLVVALHPLRSQAVLALLKAALVICNERAVDTMIVGAHRPLDTMYRWFGYDDLHTPPRWFVPGGLFPDPHCVLIQSREVLCERLAAGCPDFHRFGLLTHHPEIEPLPAGEANPLDRRGARAAAPPQGTPDRRARWTPPGSAPAESAAPAAPAGIPAAGSGGVGPCEMHEACA